LTRRRTFDGTAKPILIELTRIAWMRGSNLQPNSPLRAKFSPGVILETEVQDKAQLVEDIIEVIVKEGMVDRDKVRPDATIESLDLKSIDIVMILTAIEEKFDVYIPMDGSFQDAKDVQGLIDAIAVHIIKEKDKEKDKEKEKEKAANG
jgi:acyl carrier protein